MLSLNSEHWKMVAITLERIITNLDLQRPSFQIARTSFDAIRVPNISLYDYLARLSYYTRCSNSCYIIAFIYIDRVLQKNNELVILSRNSVHRFILISLVLAIKYVDEIYADNSFYSKIGGITLEEINRLEIEMLRLMDYNLYIDTNLYFEYLDNLTVYSQKINDETNTKIELMEDHSRKGLKIESGNSIVKIKKRRKNNRKNK